MIDLTTTDDRERVHACFAFDTWGEWLDRCATPRKTTRAGDASRRVDPEGDASWSGVGTFDAALRLAREGWSAPIPDATNLATRIRERVLGEREELSFTTVRDVTGVDLDIGAWAMGEPECMIEPRLAPASRFGGMVRLAVSASVSAYVPAESIRARGAAIMALANTLLVAGHSLEVWTVSKISPMRGRSGEGVAAYGSYATSVCVQSAADPFDAERVMFAVAHPAMLRRLTFAAEELENANLRRQFGVGTKSGGYGTPADFSRRELPNADVGSTIILPTMTGRDAWGETDAVAWIEATLDAIK